MSDSVIVVDDVSKRFRLYHERNQSLKAALMRGGRAKYEEFWALRDVSFEIKEGLTYGLIGENGSGKSTMLKCIAKILRPDKGSVTTQGKVAALLELGSGFHPELSGRENIYLNGSILGLSRKELERKFDGIVHFAGLEQFIDQPVKNYSSGMYVRLGFSVAINVDPDILLVDEVLAVGDAAFQRKCEEKFGEFRRAGKTVVVVSHAMSSMRTLCDEVAWLEHGRLVAAGAPYDTIGKYLDQTHEDREEVAGGGSRYGSGEVRIESVSLLDSHRRPTALVHTGDDVTVRIDYRADHRVERPVFGMALSSVTGTYLSASHTRDAGLVIDAVEGAGSIEFTIPRVPLLAGTFDLTVSVVDWECVHVYDFRQDCLRFDVERGNPGESGGLVSLGGQWSKPVAARLSEPA